MRDDAVWKLAAEEEGETISRARFLFCSSLSSSFRPAPSLPGDKGAFRFDCLRLPDAEPDGDGGTETPPVMTDVKGVKTAFPGFGVSAGVVEVTSASRWTGPFRATYSQETVSDPRGQTADER